jgi:hypothetical protein
VAARKTGIMETGPISTNSVMVFLMVKAKIESIIHRGWMEYVHPYGREMSGLFFSRQALNV